MIRIDPAPQRSRGRISIPGGHADQKNGPTIQQDTRATIDALINPSMTADPILLPFPCHDPDIPIPSKRANETSASAKISATVFQPQLRHPETSLRQSILNSIRPFSSLSLPERLQTQISLQFSILSINEETRGDMENDDEEEEEEEEEKEEEISNDPLPPPKQLFLLGHLAVFYLHLFIVYCCCCCCCCCCC